MEIKRFVENADEELNEFIEGQQNPNVNLKQHTSPGKHESTFESRTKWKRVKVVESSDESQE